MNCYNHPGTQAVGTCTVCGKAICQECAVDVSNRLMCQQCLSSGKATTLTQSVKPTNTLAILSLVLGLIGLCGSFPFSITAWVLGHIAQKQILENPAQEGMQYAKIGKILGIVVTALWVIGIICYIFFFVFIAINSYSTY